MKAFDLTLCGLLVFALCACKPVVTEGDWDLGGDYVLSVESSRHVLIRNWKSEDAGDVPPTVFEVGWNENYVIAKRTNAAVRTPEFWLINKTAQKTTGPFSAEEFVKEIQKAPELKQIKLKSVASLPKK